VTATEQGLISPAAVKDTTLLPLPSTISYF